MDGKSSKNKFKLTMQKILFIKNKRPNLFFSILGIKGQNLSLLITILISAENHQFHIIFHIFRLLIFY